MNNEDKSYFLNHYDRDYFKQTVQRLVKEKHMTQKQLAKLVQIAPGTFTRYFNGTLKPSLKTMIRMSYVLRIPVVSLYDPNHNDDGEVEELPNNKEIEPLLQYLQSIGFLVTTNTFGEFCIYFADDRRKEKPCTADFVLTEKIKAIVTNAVIDQMSKQ